jgi:hypothetical protein
MNSNEFRECDMCRAKPGMPILCNGCLHNRAAVERLTDALEYAVKVVDGYALEIHEAGLDAEGFCQGVLFKEAVTDINKRLHGTGDASV